MSVAFDLICRRTKLSPSLIKRSYFRHYHMRMVHGALICALKNSGQVSNLSSAVRANRESNQLPLGLKSLLPVNLGEETKPLLKRMTRLCYIEKAK